MQASILDLRRRMSEVIKALDRNEPVTILYRGKKRGVLLPTGSKKDARRSCRESSAFGMWKDIASMKDAAEYVRNLRKGRFDDL